MVWADARRQGKTKTGKDNTQRELTSTIMTVAELLDSFEEKLQICITPRVICVSGIYDYVL